MLKLTLKSFFSILTNSQSRQRNINLISFQKNTQPKKWPVDTMCTFWQEGINTFYKVHCSNLIWKQIQPGACHVSYSRGANLSLRVDLKANPKPLLKRGMCQFWLPVEMQATVFLWISLPLQVKDILPRACPSRLRWTLALCVFRWRTHGPCFATKRNKWNL